MSSPKQLVTSQMIVDITPAWWRGGPHSFADGAAIMLAMRHDDPETGLGRVNFDGIGANIVDITVGIHGVKLLIALDIQLSVAEIEAQREALAQRLNALASTNDAWTRSLQTKAELAAERLAMRRATPPPVDNDHVAPGCELFSEATIASARLSRSVS